jgi:hypothetical protein
LAAACLTTAWISVSWVSISCRFLRTNHSAEVRVGCGGVRWGGCRGGGAGWGGPCRAGAAGGICATGASRPARTGHRRMGRAPSLGLELLLELLDLPREIEGGAARVRVRLGKGKAPGKGSTGGGGQARGEQRTRTKGVAVACRPCVQLGVEARHMLVSRASGGLVV